MEPKRHIFLQVAVVFLCVCNLAFVFSLYRIDILVVSLPRIVLLSLPLVWALSGLFAAILFRTLHKRIPFQNSTLDRLYKYWSVVGLVTTTSFLLIGALPWMLFGGIVTSTVVLGTAYAVWSFFTIPLTVSLTAGSFKQGLIRFVLVTAWLCIVIAALYLLETSEHFGIKSRLTALSTPDGQYSVFSTDSLGNVYYLGGGCPECGGPSNIKIDGANADDFQVLSRLYAKSSTRVYKGVWFGGGMPNISYFDASSFEIIRADEESEMTYTRDKNHVYYNTFHWVWSVEDTSKFAQVKTDFPLNKHAIIDWFTDGENIYYQGTRIMHADPNTFRVVPSENGSTYFFARDAQNTYDGRLAKSVSTCSSEIDCVSDIRTSELDVKAYTDTIRSLLNENATTTSSFVSSETNSHVSNNELGVTFEYGAGLEAHIETLSGPPTTMELLAVVRNKGMDPTIVTISRYHRLERSELLRKNVGSQVNEDKFDKSKANMRQVVLKNQTVDKITRYYKNNDCTNIRYIHKLDDALGVVEISGLCPTHKPGFDEEKIAVAESVIFTR